MSELVQESEIVKVEMTIRVPAGATEDQVEEWLRFELHAGGSISNENPLLRFSPESWGNFGFSWSREGSIGVREEFDHEELGEGRRRYRVRYREVPVA